MDACVPITIDEDDILLKPATESKDRESSPKRRRLLDSDKKELPPELLQIQDKLARAKEMREKKKKEEERLRLEKEKLEEKERSDRNRDSRNDRDSRDRDRGGRENGRDYDRRDGRDRGGRDRDRGRDSYRDRDRDDRRERDRRDDRDRKRGRESSRDRVPEKKPRSPSPPHADWGDIYKYDYVSPIAEGAFGSVFLARDPQDGKVAIKKLKFYDPNYKREVDTLQKCTHSNLIRLIEVAVNKKNERFLVFEYYPYDFKVVVKGLNKPQLKNVMLQLLEGMEYLHTKNVIHRDLKPDNLMFTSDGILKIGDLGSARWWEAGSKYSAGMVTLRYRSPEIFMGDIRYGPAIDMWSVGCIFAEILLQKPLLDGITELEQVDRMCSVLGSPTEKNWPNFTTKYPRSKDLIFPHQPHNRLKKEIPELTDLGSDFLTRLLTYNPDFRITAAESKGHAYFTESPLPSDRLVIDFVV